MLYFQSFSGGKDSGCSIILEHENDLGHEPSTIVMAEVMFDKKRGISGERPEHMDWVRTVAKPLFESWGHKFEIVRADKDYIDLFMHVIETSRYPERIGKRAGFPICNKKMCSVKRDLKTRAIERFYKQFDEQDITQYLGIAFDEQDRLQSLKGTNQQSLLAMFEVTEAAAFQKCKPYNLISPVYEISNRGGCWFCGQQPFREFAYTKTHYPELWEELKRLSQTENLVSQCFRYSLSFQEVEQKTDQWIARMKAEEESRYQQLTLFDLFEEVKQ